MKNLILFCIAAFLLLGVVLCWLDQVDGSGRESRSGGAWNPMDLPTPPTLQEVDAHEASDSRRVRERIAVSKAPGRTNELTRLIVNVYERGSERPVPGVGIRVVPKGGREFILETCVGFTDKSGTAVLEGVSAGSVLIKTDRGPSESLLIKAQREQKVRLGVPRGWDLTGRVVDEWDRPVVRAWIWASEQSDAARPGQIVATSDSDGRFRLGALQGRKWLGARARGHAPTELIRLPERPLAGHFHVVLRFSAPGCSLAGTVRDRFGYAIPDARVRILEGNIVPNLASPPAVYCRTDESGRYTANGLQAGRATLFVRSSRFAPRTQFAQLKVGVNNRHDLVLRAGVNLSGCVTDHDGDPLAGATIRVFGLSYFESASVRTAADGSYRLRGLAPESVRAQVLSDGHQELHTVFCPEGEQELIWNPVLSPALCIKGRLIDRGSGVRNATVLLVEAETNGQRSSVSAKDGRFCFSQLQDRQYRLFVCLAERPEDQPLISCDWLGFLRPAPHEIEVRLRDERRVMVSGRLVDHRGAPVGGAPISLVQENWLAISCEPTDARTGEFKIGPLPPSRYDIVLNHRSKLGPERIMTGLVVTRGADLDLGTVRLQAPGTLRLRLRTKARLAVGDPAIWLGPTMLAKGQMGGLWKVPPGKHKLSVFGRNIVRYEREVDIKPTEAVKLTIDLLPGVRRQIVFPVPALIGFKDDRPFSLVLRGIDNGIHRELKFDTTRNGWPVHWFPSLGTGRYLLEVRPEGGVPLHGRFSVADLTPTLEPVTVRLRERW